MLQTDHRRTITGGQLLVNDHRRTITGERLLENNYRRAITVDLQNSRVFQIRGCFAGLAYFYPLWINKINKFSIFE